MDLWATILSILSLASMVQYTYGMSIKMQISQLFTPALSSIQGSCLTSCQGAILRYRPQEKQALNTTTIQQTN